MIDSYVKSYNIDTCFERTQNNTILEHTHVLEECAPNLLWCLVLWRRAHEKEWMRNQPCSLTVLMTKCHILFEARNWLLTWEHIVSLKVYFMQAWIENCIYLKERERERDRLSAFSEFWLKCLEKAWAFLQIMVRISVQASASRGQKEQVAPGMSVGLGNQAAEEFKPNFWTRTRLFLQLLLL